MQNLGEIRDRNCSTPKEFRARVYNFYEKGIVKYTTSTNEKKRPIPNFNASRRSVSPLYYCYTVFYYNKSKLFNNSASVIIH